MNFNLQPSLNGIIKNDLSDLEKYYVDISEIDNLFIINKDDILYTDNELLISGLLINNGHLIIKNSSIMIIGNGVLKNNGKLTFTTDKKISVLRYFSVKKNIVGDYQETGFFIDQDIDSVESISVVVNGPKDSFLDWEAKFDFKLGKKFETPCYFSNDNGFTAKNKIEKGDQLFWNSTFSGFDVYQTWNIKILFNI
jgi:hypothetical protein